MTAYELITQLDEAGSLGALYKCGLINLKAYNSRDLYARYVALLCLPHYADAPADAVREVMREYRVSRATVYGAIKEMRREV